MPSDTKQHLKTILHPYLFILKEGGKIKNDFLDYSLMMLLINSSETIKSPQTQTKNIADIVSKMELSIHTIPTIIGNSEKH